MAKISTPDFIRCDRCGYYVQDDSYHSRLIVKGGFSDLNKDKRGLVITARDLCALCEHKLIEWLDEPTNTEPIDWEENPRKDR